MQQLNPEEGQGRKEPTQSPVGMQRRTYKKVAFFCFLRVFIIVSLQNLAVVYLFKGHCFFSRWTISDKYLAIVTALYIHAWTHKCYFHLCYFIPYKIPTFVYVIKFVRLF